MMYKKIFQLSAVASVVVASMATAQAAQLDSLDINATNNLYYTGKMPNTTTLEKLDEDGAQPDITKQYYTGWRMALNNYPTYVDKRCKILINPGWYDGNGDLNPGEDDSAVTDTNRTCYGSVPQVVDLTGYAGTTLHFRVPSTETISSVGPAGAGADTYTGLPLGGIIAVFATSDYDVDGNGTIEATGLTKQGLKNEAPTWWDNSGVITSYNALGDLQTYANAVPSILADGNSNLTDNASTQGWRTNFPGFRELDGEPEFAPFATATTVGGYQVASVTIPADATHLVLGYSAEQLGFNAALTDTFSLEVSDSSTFDDSAIQATIAPTVTGATAAGTDTYDVVVGDSVSIDANASATGVTIAADAYAWSAGGANETETSDTLAYTFGAAGTVPVVITINDTVNNVAGSKTLTFNVVAAAVTTAGFTKTVSDLGVSFTSTSAAGAGITAPLTYLWNFGDGETSSLANPQHTYAAAGTYTVSLTVTDSNNDTDVSTDSVTVTAAATTEPEPTEPTPTTGGGGGGSLSWFFGLGLLAPAFIRRRFKK